MSENQAKENFQQSFLPLIRMTETADGGYNLWFLTNFATLEKEGFAEKSLLNVK